nr:hypothetical protein [Tanacetum cinerariifolium]
MIPDTPIYTSIRSLIRHLAHRLLTLSVAGRHSGKEKVTLDDLFLLHSMNVGERGSLRSVTLRPETSLLNVAKLVDLDIYRYNGLGYGELVDDIPDNDDDEGAGDDDAGGMRRCPNMSFTNRLRAMDERLGKMETDISRLGIDVDDLTYNVGNQNGLSVVPGSANQNGNINVAVARAEGNGNGNNENQIRCYNCQGVDHYARNCTVKPKKRDAAYLQIPLQIAQKEESGIQPNFEEFDFMAAADGSAEVHHSEYCYDNDIFNMLTQEEKYTELLEPISKPHQVQQNDNIVISVVSNMEQSEGTVEQNTATVEETRAYFESLYNNLAIEVEKVNTVISKVVEMNDLSKTVTSNSVPTTTESKVMTNDKMIAPGMFRINPFKTSKEDKFVPINKVRASIRTNPITVSQSHVITKKYVNSDSNGLSFTGVANTAKTRRPQPRSNTKNDWVPSGSKSSCVKNK